MLMQLNICLGVPVIVSVVCVERDLYQLSTGRTNNAHYELWSSCCISAKQFRPFSPKAVYHIDPDTCHIFI